MTISPGLTAAEIREFVHEYQLVPHGRKGLWLAARASPISGCGGGETRCSKATSIGD